MRLITFYLHAPSSPGVQPMFVPISGDFDRVEDAHQIAVATATKNPRFADWCVAFEIENEASEIVSKWKREDA